MGIRTITSACVIYLAILTALPAVAVAAAGTAQDRAVLGAHAAFLSGDRARLAGYAEKARGHVLEPYIGFWRLRLRLEEADPGEVRGFLGRNAGTLVAEQLRRDWLRVLARSGQWEAFLEEYPALVKPDSDIAGYILQARWYSQDVTALSDVRSFWNAPRALPEGVAPLVETMVSLGEITPRDLRHRFRILIRANLYAEAKRIVERLPPGEAPQAAQIDSVLRDPAGFLDRSGTQLKTAVERELAIVALSRLAQSDLRTAVGYWKDPLREAFPLEDRQYLWAMLGTLGARSYLPEAVDWFREAGEIPLSDEQLAWRARNALRQENWQEVETAIERMSSSERNEPAWVYWLGRSRIALGDPEAGGRVLRRIAGEHHFYGQLAGEELGCPLQIPPKAAPPTRKELDGAATHAGLQRALALYRLGLRTEGTREWIWSVRTMDDRSLLAAAELAKRNKIWDRAMNTADRTVAAHDFTLRYLTPYRDVLAKQARNLGIEAPLIFGLVRQESRFMADAKSPAGAAGLMQILPTTARWVAQKIGMKGFQPSRVSRPEVNAALGAFYLRHVLDGFRGNPVLAAAAYNAGPGRARRWCDAKPLEGAIYVETIPFAETRQYVKKVMANTVYYAAIFGGEPRSLKSRLGTVGGPLSMRETAGE
jgi:soluble lytic murein transglycosylase